VAGGAALLALALGGDAIHQAFVRMPEQVEVLRQQIDAEEAGLVAGEGNGAIETRRLLHAVATGRVSSRLGNPNLLAAVLCVAWPLCAAGAFGTRLRWLRYATMAIGGVLIPAVLWMTASRGGMLTLVFAAGLWALAMLRTRQQAAFARFAAIMLVGLVAGYVLDRAAPRAELDSTPRAAVEQSTGAALPTAAPSAPSADDGGGRASRGTTIRQRVGFLKVGLAMLPEALPWGFGIGGYARHFFEYQPPRQQPSQYAHHWPLQVAIEMGIPGLAAYALIAVLIAAFGAGTFWRLTRRSAAAAPTDGPPAGELANPLQSAALVAAATTIAFLTFLANGCVEISFYDVQIAAVAWLCAGLALGTADLAFAARRVVPTGTAVWSTLHRAVFGAIVVLGAIGIGVLPISAPRIYHALEDERAWFFAEPTIAVLADPALRTDDRLLAERVGQFVDTFNEFHGDFLDARTFEWRGTSLLAGLYHLDRLILFENALARLPEPLSRRAVETARRTDFLARFGGMSEWRPSIPMMRARIALQRLRRMAELAGENPDPLTILGKDAYPFSPSMYIAGGRGDLQEIDRMLQEAIQRAPNDAATLREAANIYDDLGTPFFERLPDRRGISEQLRRRAREVDYELAP
jgi:hypothetical protein